MLERVGKYEVIEEIGHGGMATVYRARDSRLGREVALKVLHPHLRGTAEARARFEREAIAVASLRHPSILEIYDYGGEEAEHAFIATELLTGPTLRAFADAHPEIPAEIAACMVIRIARALSAAHGQGIVHRDVKPENIMIHAGDVKLTDFGIAQLVDAQGMTTTGQVLGSPGHMAPEQIEGKACDESTDLFSLGTVLYLLATGELPFVGRNPHAVLKQIMDGRFRDPMEVRGSIGGKLRAIIRRCLEVEPKKRHGSAAELADALGEFVAEVGIDDPHATLRTYLEDPEGFTTRFRAQLVDRLTTLGEQAQQARNLPVAMDHFNRVLALDDGNERVLEAVQQLGSRSRLRRWSVAAAGALALGAAAVALWGLLPRSGADGALVRMAPVEVAAVRADDGAQGVPAADDPAVPDAGPGPTPAAVDDVGDGDALARGAGGRPRTGRSDTPREVRFEPFPQNVAISIDGGPARDFGPSFRGLTLSPGEHSFGFVGAHDCCVDAERSVRIPPGPGETVVRQRLAFKPAGLYIAANRAAYVSVDGGTVSGRTLSIIQVPHARALTERHTVRVTADGYRDHVQEVELQAGQVRTVPVELLPIAVVGDAPPG